MKRLGMQGIGPLARVFPRYAGFFASSIVVSVLYVDGIGTIELLRCFIITLESEIYEGSIYSLKS